MGTGQVTKSAGGPTRRRLMGLAVGLALLGGGVACGGSGSKPAATVAATDGTTTTTDAGAAYAACLKDHGVDLPVRPGNTDGAGGPPSSRPANADGAGGPPSSRTGGTRPPGGRPSTSLPPGVDASQAAAARQACQSLQPANRGANGPQGQAFQAYASCMKDHGVTVGGGPGAGAPDREDPAFKAGDAICAPLRPTQP